jgi:hypothetical protein
LVDDRFPQLQFGVGHGQLLTVQQTWPTAAILQCEIRPGRNADRENRISSPRRPSP